MCVGWFVRVVFCGCLVRLYFRLCISFFLRLIFYIFVMILERDVMVDLLGNDDDYGDFDVFDFFVVYINEVLLLDVLDDYVLV